MRKKAENVSCGKAVAITKHGITHYVAVRPLKETKGFIPGLNTKNLRDKSDRIS